MKEEDKPTEGNGLVAERALARRSDALVLRGIRDLEATDRLQADAEFEKGLEYYDSENFAEAAIHYCKAVELGHFRSCLALVNLNHYLMGGVKLPAQTAGVLFGKVRETAEGGDREAQVALGSMYRFGLGTTPDHVQALGWWRRAAEQGDTDVEVFHIAECYHDGRGVPEDHEALSQPRRWERLASRLGRCLPQRPHDPLLTANNNHKVRLPDTLAYFVLPVSCERFLH